MSRQSFVSLLVLILIVVVATTTAAAAVASPIQHSDVAKASPDTAAKPYGNLRSTIWDIQAPIFHSNMPRGGHLRAQVKKAPVDASA
eukprot:scaffold1695_cov167-Amphora_coffeaeformis.AAC.27